MIDKLLEFYKEDPADPFNSYALALAYLKTDTSRALDWFRVLLREHPGYLPVYYQAAGVLAEAGYTEEAEAVYKKGIELAGAQQNTRTMQELQRAYRSFLDELEDY